MIKRIEGVKIEVESNELQQKQFDFIQKRVLTLISEELLIIDGQPVGVDVGVSALVQAAVTIAQSNNYSEEEFVQGCIRLYRSPGVLS